MFQYINQLHPLFECQPFAAVGSKEGKWQALMTDRRLILQEKVAQPANTEATPIEYVPVCEFGTDIVQFDADTGAFSYPEGAKVLTSVEVDDINGKPAVPIKNMADTIAGIMVGMTAFSMPAAASKHEGAWALFHFKGGNLAMRFSDTYDGLLTAPEALCAPSETVEGEHAFAVPADVVRVCLGASDKCAAGFLAKGPDTYFTIKTPDFDAIYACKHMGISHLNKEAASDAADLAASAPPADEPTKPLGEATTQPQESTSEEQSTEQVSTEEQESTEEDGKGPEEVPAVVQVTTDTVQGDGASVPAGGEGAEETPKPRMEDVDPMEALDVHMADLIRSTKEVAHSNMVSMEKLRKNVAKQCRKALKSVGNDSQRAQLATANDRADKAEKLLSSLRSDLAPFRGVLNVPAIKTLFNK